MSHMSKKTYDKTCLLSMSDEDVFTSQVAIGG